MVATVVVRRPAVVGPLGGAVVRCALAPSVVVPVRLVPRCAGEGIWCASDEHRGGHLCMGPNLLMMSKSCWAVAHAVLVPVGLRDYAWGARLLESLSSSGTMLSLGAPLPRLFSRVRSIVSAFASSSRRLRASGKTSLGEHSLG